MVTRAHPKVPRTPPAPLRRNPEDVVAFGGALWRIHRTQGAHVLPWNTLRTYGPLPVMRFDPQPEPTGIRGDGVMYAATELPAPFAETFQATRVIDTASFQPRLTAWIPTRELRLLDLTGTWALRNQAAQSLAAAPRSTCRAWARGIYNTWPDLDGLWVPSTMTNTPNVVLWNPAATSFPPAPAFSRPLTDPVVRAVAARIAAQLGYRIA